LDAASLLATGPRWLAAAVLIGLTVIAYLPALRGGFVWDDDTSLSRFVKSADGLRLFWLTTRTPDYWPVTSTTFWVEWRLWGMNPLGYHVTNLALHVAAVLLLWAVLRRLRIPGAFLAALLFAVHPVNVQTVAWITQRKGLMAMLFYLLSIYFFVRWSAATSPRLLPAGVEPARRGHPVPPRPLAGGENGRPLWYGLSLLAFALAMLSKGSVAILPLVLLGIIAWRRRIGFPDILRTAPFFLVAGILALVDIWFQRHNLAAGEVVRHASGMGRLLGAGEVVWFYLGKALLPVNLTFFYPLWHIRPESVLWWLPLLGAVGLTSLLWYKASLNSPSSVIPSGARNPAAAANEIPRSARNDRIDGPEIWRGALFAWGYFCVALIPVMGFTDVYFMKFSLVEDHYQHLALIGVTTLAAAFWTRWWARSASLAGVAAALVVGLFVGLTWHQCLMYRDAATLLETTLQGNPDSALAHNDLGVIFAEAGRLPDAQAQFAEALRLDPNYADAQRNVGLTLAREGRWLEALPHYGEALRLNVSSAETHDDFGNALLWLGKPADAALHFQQAIQLDPTDAEAQCNLGIALARLGRLADAIPHYAAALQLEPNNAAIHANFANVLRQAGQLRAAMVQYEEVLRIRPGDPQVQADLAGARAELLAPAGNP
jgi:tetratricopeptide (TPR) repeat protein